MLGPGGLGFKVRESVRRLKAWLSRWRAMCESSHAFFLQHKSQTASLSQP